MTRRNSSPPQLTATAPWTLINKFTAPEDLPVLQLLSDCYVCDSFRAITPIPQCGLYGPAACQKLNVTADQRDAPQAQEVAHSLLTRLFRGGKVRHPPPSPSPAPKSKNKTKGKPKRQKDVKSSQSVQPPNQAASQAETEFTPPLDQDEARRKKSGNAQNQAALEDLVCLLDIAVHADISHVFLHVLVSLTSQLDDIQLPEVNIASTFLRAAGQETTISDMAGSLATYAESVSATLASSLNIKRRRRSSNAPRRSSHASQRSGHADRVCQPDRLFTPSGSGVTPAARHPQFVTEAHHQAALSDADSFEETKVLRGCGGFWRRAGRRPVKSKWSQDTGDAKVNLQPVLPLRGQPENVVLTSLVDDDDPPGAPVLWADTARGEVLNSPLPRLTHRQAECRPALPEMPPTFIPPGTQAPPRSQPTEGDARRGRSTGRNGRPRDAYEAEGCRKEGECRRSEAAGRRNERGPPAQIQRVNSPRTESRLRKVLHFRAPAKKQELAESPEEKEERLYLVVVEVISCLASVIAFAEQTGALAVVLRLREADGASRKLARIAELERALSVWLLNCHKVTTPCLFTDRPWTRQTYAIVTSCPMSRGDHLYRQIRGKGTLSLMTHHGMYVGEGRVIHFSGNEFALKSLLFPSQESTKLRKTNILEFMKYGGVLHVEKYVDTNNEPAANGAHACVKGGIVSSSATPVATPSTVASRSEVIRVEGRSESDRSLVVRNSPRAIEKVEYNKHMILWPTQAMCFNEKGAYYAQADPREQSARRAEFAYAFFHWRRALKTNTASPAEPELQDLLKEMASEFEFPAYSLFSNNCEHFCRWCKTGTAISLQVDVVGATVDAFLRGFFHK